MDAEDLIDPAEACAIPDDINATVKPSSRLVPKKSLLLRFGKHMQPLTNKWIAGSFRIGDKPLFDSSEFPWVKALEAHWREIRAEALKALEDLKGIPPLATISPDHRRIAPAGRWRSFFLVGYGYREETNCRACPRTAELISSIPGLNRPFSRSWSHKPTFRPIPASPRHS